MKNTIKRIFGGGMPSLKKSQFSKFFYDASPTQKRRLIEEVIKDANLDQRELVERVERKASIN